ncbi:MAG: hypothetical protein ACREI9_01710 [Nitrospiraceae bacterium]
MQAETKKVLIVARTYPTPAKKGVEVSCTAGITTDGKWIRLFPVPYRFLDDDQRFSKYQTIEVSVIKASDARPESYKIIGDSIKILSLPLSTANGWAARKEVLRPLKAHCLCCLKKERDANGFPTLGFFQPKKITCLLIDEDEKEWTEEQLAALRQMDLFGKAKTVELEKVPHNFRYKFQCDEDSCKGHTITCTDWEMGQAWRRWRKDYGSGWQEKFRQKFEEEMINKFDTHLFAGTIHGHPHTWIIIGLFYPPKDDALPLFDGLTG